MKITTTSPRSQWVSTSKQSLAVTITLPLRGRLAPWFSELGANLSPWWRHQMETFSALLAICAGNSPVPGEFPTQRPVMRSFDVYFDLRPNKRLSKQSWGWWFETPSRPLWRYRNGNGKIPHITHLLLWTDSHLLDPQTEVWSFGHGTLAFQIQCFQGSDLPRHRRMDPNPRDPRTEEWSFGHGLSHAFPLDHQQMEMS